MIKYRHFLIAFLALVGVDPALATPNTTQPNLQGMALSECIQNAQIVGGGTGSGPVCYSVVTGTDGNLNIASTTNAELTPSSFTAARTWTLPSASSFGKGNVLFIGDTAGAINGTDTLTLSRAGSDTINGASTFVISTQYAVTELVSDGSSKWAIQVANGSGTVTSVTCGTGLSGGTITTSGTCALALSNATVQASPSPPAGTTSATGVMEGFGTSCHLTPTYSGRVLLNFRGSAFNTTSGQFWVVQAQYGTGIAPSAGASPTGTAIGTGSTSTPAAANQTGTINSGGIITGLTVGTAVWFDILLKSSGTGTATVNSVSCDAMEF